MRIDQANILEALQKSSQDNQETTVIPTKKASAAKCDETGSVAVNMREATYGNPAKEEKTFLDQLEESMSMDVTDRKNQMTVLSHTTSPEDYKKMEEEGFSMHSTEGHTIVTVTDKIKVAMAKGGADVSYGDGISRDEMEEITGNAAVANQISNALEAADLPVSDENMEDSLEAYEQAGALEPLNEGAMKYMLDNRLEPSIANLYKAEYSGSTNYSGQTDSEIDFEALQSQIEQVIQNAGLEVNEETIADSKWMIENQVLFTAENLAYLEELKGLSLPAEGADVINAMVTAVSENMRPQDGMLLPGYSMKDQAEHAVEIIAEASDEDLAYIVEHEMELTISNLEEAKEHRGEKSQAGESTSGGVAEAGAYTEKGLALLTAQRQLEETRLAMTTEANLSLLKQGISIDTKPLVELVEQLKNAENDYYTHLLEAAGVEASEENVSLFAETTTKLQEMATVPAYVLGTKSADVTSIQGVHEAGTILKDTFEKANESYEALKTAPRADMGDSIQKAFQNVDDILEDLGMETSQANERAVRILGYNSIEITPESILEMKAADEEVQRVFAGLTPKTVVEMIRRNENPLDMDFTTLNQKIAEIQQETGENDNEKFSKYLWKLEQNNEISEEERSSYIGIYRLIAQVEKTDGAAIGALVNQGAELTMRNLMTAVRTERRGSVDITVDDNFGEIEELTKEGLSVTEQVETAYQSNCIKDVLENMTPENMKQLLATEEWQNMTPEQLKEAMEQVQTQEEGIEQEYYKEQIQDLEACARASQDVYDMLEHFQIPNTITNVLAAQQYMQNRNEAFRKLFGSYENPDEITQDDLEQIKQEILERFGEAVKTPKEMAEAQETLAEVAEHALDNMIMIDDNVSSVDIKAMRLVNAQMSIFAERAKEENYAIPVLVNGEVTNVELKIVRGTKKKGMVDIMMDINRMGKIAAKFQAKEESISGLIATDNKETKDFLAENLGLFSETIQEKNQESVDLSCAFVDDLNLDRFSTSVEKTETGFLLGAPQEEALEEEVDAESYEVQTSRLYQIAESFIRTIKEITA
ncbi:MAG: DUF6240 domain-containing protein [Roseburia sp.]